MNSLVSDRSAFVDHLLPRDGVGSSCGSTEGSKSSRNCCALASPRGPAAAPAALSADAARRGDEWPPPPRPDTSCQAAGPCSIRHHQSTSACPALSSALNPGLLVLTAGPPTFCWSWPLPPRGLTFSSVAAHGLTPPSVAARGPTFSSGSTRGLRIFSVSTRRGLIVFSVTGPDLTFSSVAGLTLSSVASLPTVARLSPPAAPVPDFLARCHPRAGMCPLTSSATVRCPIPVAAAAGLHSDAVSAAAACAAAAGSAAAVAAAAPAAASAAAFAVSSCQNSPTCRSNLVPPQPRVRPPSLFSSGAAAAAARFSHFLRFRAVFVCLLLGCPGSLLSRSDPSRIPSSTSSLPSSPPAPVA